MASYLTVRRAKVPPLNLPGCCVSMGAHLGATPATRVKDCPSPTISYVRTRSPPPLPRTVWMMKRR